MTFRSVSVTAKTNSGTALTGSAPSGLTAGDRLLAYAVQDGTGITFTPPAGWTSIGKIDAAGPDGETAELFEIKSATGSEAYDWTCSSTNYALLIIGAWPGRHATDAAVAQSTSNTSSNTTPISVALTGVTVPAGADVAWFASLDKTAANGVWDFSSLSGYTERYDTNAAGSFVTGALYTADNQTGATGTLTATATRTGGSGNAGFNGFVVAIPASGGGGGPVKRNNLMLMGLGR